MTELQKENDTMIEVLDGFTNIKVIVSNTSKNITKDIDYIKKINSDLRLILDNTIYKLAKTNRNINKLWNLKHIINKRLDNTINKLDYYNKILKDENIEMKHKINNLENDKLQIKKENIELRSDKKGLHKRVELLENEVKELKLENKELKLENKELKLENKELKEIVNKLNLNMNKLLFSQSIKNIYSAIQDLNYIDQLETKFDDPIRSILDLY